MKWWLAAILALLLACPARAEGGEAYTVYVIDYDEEALADWNAKEYLEAPGTVVSLYCEHADAQISLIESSLYESAEEYLRQRLLKNANTVRIQAQNGPREWEAPWGGGGGRLELTYVYVSGEFESEPYYERAYIAPFNDDFYLSIALNGWTAEAPAAMDIFEQAIFAGQFRTYPIEVTNVAYGFLHEAEMSDGALYMAVDTFIIDQGTETSDIVVHNNDSTLVRYSVAAGANMWIMPRDALFEWEKIPYDAAAVSAFISEYVLEYGSFPAFRLFMNGTEVVWMEQLSQFGAT